MAKQVFQAIRGMNDMLPTDAWVWQRLERACAKVSAQYGYQEIRTPILEATQLFKRSIGDATDIVEKEMYSFDDRNGDSLSLRPEGTAACVRAGIQHGLLYNQVQRLWYIGPMFRHERPQKGRYRQFYQFGVEAFGMAAAEVDAEIILLSQRLWHELGLNHRFELQINSLGKAATRKHYHQALIAYFSEHENALDDDSKRRLHKNPLRILDSKNPALKNLISAAPKLLDFLDDSEQQHFVRVQHLLEQAGVKFVINPCLVRGLDYYCHTVFEWVSDELGAQGTVCAGGRYDTLVERFGAKPTPAIGFAMGLERIILILQTLSEAPTVCDAYMLMLGEQAKSMGSELAEQCRSAIPQLRLVCDYSNSAYKTQLKRALNAKASVAIIIDEQQLAAKTIKIKQLNSDEQLSVAHEDFLSQLKKLL